MNIRTLGRIDYHETVQKMQSFTADRTTDTPDEIWICEHAPVYTFGRHADPSHLLNPNDIPVVNTDRGGQITYHGPGQIVVYYLVDLKRQGTGPKDFVCQLESFIIHILAEFGVHGEREVGKPGIFVNGDKIASIGLRIKRGRTYHGIALNVEMDLGPFSHINPCGYEGLNMTQLHDLTDKATYTAVLETVEVALQRQSLSANCAQD